MFNRRVVLYGRKGSQVCCMLVQVPKAGPPPAGSGPPAGPPAVAHRTWICATLGQRLSDVPGHWISDSAKLKASKVDSE